MRLSSISLALGSQGLLFDPLSLFAAGVPGALFYITPDFAGMYQDSAGTTPVTAVEQPDGLWLDRRLGLVRGSELATNGDFSSGTTGWSSAFGGILSVGAGALTVTKDGSGGLTGRATQTLTCQVGKVYELSGTIVAASGAAGISVGAATSGAALADASVKPAVFAATATTLYVRLTTGAATLGDYATFDNISVREIPGNHASQSTASSRPVVSARYNLLTATEDLTNASWTKAGASIAANATAAPDGTLTAGKIVEDTTTATHSAKETVTAASGPSYTFSCYAKRAGRDIQLVASDASAGQMSAFFDLQAGAVSSVSGGSWSTPSATISTVGNGWYRCALTGTKTAGSTAIAQILCASGATTNYTGDGSSGAYVWGAGLRLTSDAALSIPAYQRVTTAADYDTAGFPPYPKADGIDDYWTQASGGGATAGFFLCGAITVLGGAATARTLWSDAGTNTGYRVRVNASNKLELAAGNATAFTTIATVGTLPVGETHVVTAWDDGTNLNVQIDQGATATVARPAVAAGTSTVTIARDNGVSSSYLNARLYDLVQLQSAPSLAQIAQTQRWSAGKAGVAL